ncbi:hypothetical protein B0H10DRAFT_1299128 [Mycena sp. CBHHK59/15]|nr:hypothetical protein B0H10DRAFT_1299128 [Mycena sp. CBHHK59/15]
MSRERHKESKEKRGEKTGVTEEESVNVRDKEVRLAPETLRQLATHQRPAYGPDFLRTFAKGRSDGTLFDVITGRDAHRFCRRFVREQAGKDGNAKGSEGKGKEREREREKEKEREKSEKTLPPVVFALSRSTAGDAGRKVVDYYMTWRGKTKTTRLKGLARRAGFLDAEFRRVRETLDGEWKRASRVLRPSSHYEPDTEANGKGVPQLVRAPTDPQALPRLAPSSPARARTRRRKRSSRRMMTRMAPSSLHAPYSARTERASTASRAFRCSAWCVGYPSGTGVRFFSIFFFLLVSFCGMCRALFAKCSEWVEPVLCGVVQEFEQEARARVPEQSPECVSWCRGTRDGQRNTEADIDSPGVVTRISARVNVGGR